MDAHTLSALELPKVLEYLAGFAVSESGRQACLALRPGNNLEEIRAQAALFEQGRLWAQKSALPLLPFIALDDLLRYAERPTAVLDLEALWEVRRMLIQAKELRLDILAGERENAWPLWLDRCRRTPLPDKSLSALSRCLSEEGLLRDEASPELFRLREELRGLHRQCLRKARDLAAEYNILHYIQDDFLTLASDRYVLPLKANFQGRLRGIIHDYSRTGETCYFEPLFLVQINNRIQELKREERKEEGRILAFLSDLARDELPAIRACRDFLVDVDLLKARHSLALCYDGRLVLLEADGGVLLREARHPLLALASSASAVRALAALRRSGQADGQEDRLAAPDPLPDPLGAVPVTLELPPGRQALIISGGNAGGKTVALKTLGLTALMTLCALPVPAQAGSRLPPWRRLHAFIGDGQSLDEHVSTFTAQIAHLARIWPGLGPDALILLDEFGAGTDPAQGAALARAVLETAMDHGALVCAATHFPALKAYALSDGRVRAASVLFDPATRRPLFRLAYDQVGSSQALEVAREHGLPEEILARAEADLLPGGEEAADLLDRLNSLAALRETEVDALARQRRSLEQERQGMLEEAAREKERLSASIQAESRQILASWQAARLSHKQALRELSRLRSALAA
ncbi:MAG: endonuclease MutS2, partial [Deltaproteobacteria bacterium]|nr:endonuclease MutS2 [Deltaproteobacteria bacterium]